MKYLLIIIFSLFTFMSCFIAAGSYANAESYIVDIEYSNSESIMKKLKETHTELEYYYRNEDGELTKSQDRNGFIVYYLPNINYSVSCRIIPLDNPKQTRVLLVDALNTKSNEGVKSINTSGIPKAENKKIKKEFETEILNKLGKWEHYVNGFLRFFGFN